MSAGCYLCLLILQQKAVDFAFSWSVSYFSIFFLQICFSFCINVIFVFKNKIMNQHRPQVWYKYSIIFSIRGKSCLKENGFDKNPRDNNCWTQLSTRWASLNAFLMNLMPFSCFPFYELIWWRWVSSTFN